MIKFKIFSIFLLFLAFFGGIILAAHSSAKKAHRLEPINATHVKAVAKELDHGPYIRLSDYCRGLTLGPETVCNVDRTWISLPTVVLAPPFEEIKFFETGDEVTRTCSLGLRTSLGWFVFPEMIECYISAGTVRIDAHANKVALKQGVLTLHLTKTESHLDQSSINSLSWVIDEKAEVVVTCRVDADNFPSCN